MAKSKFIKYIPGDAARTMYDTSTLERILAHPRKALYDITVRWVERNTNYYEVGAGNKENYGMWRSAIAQLWLMPTSITHMRNVVRGKICANDAIELEVFTAFLGAYDSKAAYSEVFTGFTSTRVAA